MTPEAALQAARRFDPQATAEQIVPTRLDLTILYQPGVTTFYQPKKANARWIKVVHRGSDGWNLLLLKTP